jgi:hypothetical protein
LEAMIGPMVVPHGQSFLTWSGSGLGLGLGLGLVVPHHELLHGEAGTPRQLTHDEAALGVRLSKARLERVGSRPGWGPAC